MKYNCRVTRSVIIIERDDSVSARAIMRDKIVHISYIIWEKEKGGFYGKIEAQTVVSKELLWDGGADNYDDCVALITEKFNELIAY